MSHLWDLDEIGMGSGDSYRVPKSGHYPQKPVSSSEVSYFDKYAPIILEFNHAVNAVNRGDAPQDFVVSVGKSIMKKFAIKYGAMAVATVLNNSFGQLGSAFDYAKDKWHDLANRDRDNPNETDPVASKKQHSKSEIDDIRNQARIDDANLDNKAIKRFKPRWDLEYGYYGVKDMGKGRIIIPNSLDINKLYVYTCNTSSAVVGS
jgi:hypothetical protein